MLLSFQKIRDALFVSAAQSAFVNTLMQSLPVLAAGADPIQVVAIGAGQIRGVFPPEDLPGTLASYLEGIKVTYLLKTALTATAFMAALFFPWKRPTLPQLRNVEELRKSFI